MHAIDSADKYQQTEIVRLDLIHHFNRFLLFNITLIPLPKLLNMVFLFLL